MLLQVEMYKTSPVTFFFLLCSAQFALSPSDFSSSEVPEEELDKAASRGVKIMYSFPWGPESLETLWCRGDAELLRTHGGVRSKLQVSLCLFFFHKDAPDS